MPENIKINGKAYRIPTAVTDIAMRDFIRWTETERAEMPDELRTIVEDNDGERKALKAKRLPKRTYARKIIPYYAKIISILAGIPENTLLGDNQNEGCPVMVLEAWYWRAVNALASFEHNPAIDRFEIAGQMWALPEPNMERSTFGQFAEAAQYEDYAADVAGGNWSRIPHVMAVLLRPVGEGYDPYKFDNDDFVEQRAEIMRGVTMDTVYQVCFFLLARNEHSRTDSLIYTLARLLATLKRDRKN